MTYNAHTSLDQLDPNYVVVISYSENDLHRILNEFTIRNLDIVTRPGHNASTLYGFIRVDNEEEQIALFGLVQNEKSRSIQSITPITNSESSKKLNVITDKLIWGKVSGASSAKRLVPTDGELKELSNCVQDPDQVLYFAFYKKYIMWLVWVGIVGVCKRFLASGRNSTWEFNLDYTIMLGISTIFFAADWVHNSKRHYSILFGKNKEYPLANDNKDLMASFIKKMCFLPVALVFGFLLIAFQLLCFGIEIFISQLYAGPLKSILSLLPTVLISTYTPILTMVYNSTFVEKFIIWENSPNPTKSKVEKNFILTFLSSYMPLLITLFLYIPLGYQFDSSRQQLVNNWASRFYIPTEQEDFKVNLNRFRNQFFYFVVTNQVILIVMDNLMPIIMAKLLPLVKSKINQKQASIEAANEDKVLCKVKQSFSKDYRLWNMVRQYYTGPWGEFNADDAMKKVIIQFGYVVMFSTIWPLAPLICLIFNFFIFRADLWRAFIKCRPSVTGCYVFTDDLSPPNSSGTSRSGLDNDVNDIQPDIWDTILEIIAILGVVISFLLTIMYRKANLPGVGYQTSLEKRDQWYKYDPIPHSRSTVLITGIIVEHVSIFFYFAFAKVFDASRAKIVHGFVPSTSKISEKSTSVDQFDIVKATTKFMKDIQPDKETAKTTLFDKSGRRTSTTSNTTALKAVDKGTREQQKATEELRDIGDKDIDLTTMTRANNNVDHYAAREGAIPKPIPQTVYVSTPAAANISATKVTKTTLISSSQPSDLPNQKENNESNLRSSTGRRKSVKSVASSTSNGYSSIVAGATIPEVIPTSKNYDSRYDKNGNLLRNVKKQAPVENTSSQKQRKLGENGLPIVDGQSSQQESLPLAAAAANAALVNHNEGSKAATAAPTLDVTDEAHPSTNEGISAPATNNANMATGGGSNSINSTPRKSSLKTTKKNEIPLRQSASKHSSLNSSKSSKNGKSKEKKGLLQKIKQKL